MRRNHSLLDLLLELQALDRVPRSGYALRGVAQGESVSEHSFHLTFLAWALAAEEPDLDRTRVMELALVHDLAEVRTGDLPRTAAHYLPEGAKATAERAAAGDLLAPLGDGATALVDEYQGRETTEARFVATCDKLQLLIKASVYERWGARGMEEFWHRFDEFPDGGFASISRLLAELKTRRRS
ncbi:MAG: HD domain-containing protein [bacterium]|nr:HD domain-containing protein [bacterium]